MRDCVAKRTSLRTSEQLEPGFRPMSVNHKTMKTGENETLQRGSVGHLVCLWRGMGWAKGGGGGEEGMGRNDRSNLSRHMICWLEKRNFVYMYMFVGRPRTEPQRSRAKSQATAQRYRIPAMPIPVCCTEVFVGAAAGRQRRRRDHCCILKLQPVQAALGRDFPGSATHAALGTARTVTRPFVYSVVLTWAQASCKILPEFTLFPSNYFPYNRSSCRSNPSVVYSWNPKY